MRETTMNYWQIAQFFLSDTGVHEVEVHLTSAKLKCNCSWFEARNSCKHVRFVSNKMKENDGVYPVEVSTRASREATFEASQNSAKFYKFLVQYGKIEVL